MSDQPSQPTAAAASVPPGTPPTAESFPMPQGIEWLWWGVLVVSLLIGFGLTIFAPV